MSKKGWPEQFMRKIKFYNHMVPAMAQGPYIIFKEINSSREKSSYLYRKSYGALLKTSVANIIIIVISLRWDLELELNLTINRPWL